jgi:hypothetical protein
MNVFQKHGDVKVASICDVYEPNLEHAISEAVKGGSHPRACRNYKDLLADKDIQAVLIATPEHWHYQMVMDAIAAGKDIYVEKPLCRTRRKASGWWRRNERPSASFRWACSAGATIFIWRRARWWPRARWAGCAW